MPLTMWGFLGLLAATILDYGLALIHVKATGTPVPIWYPVRLLGTLAGLALLYGVTGLLIVRFRHATTRAADSKLPDWTLLGASSGSPGLADSSSRSPCTCRQAPVWGYWVFLFHVALAMELVLLAPFMKFAHAAYRPVALFFLGLRTAGTTQ